MKRIMFFLFLLGSITFSKLDAQTYGKLYSKQEADNIYGPVLESVSLSTSILKSLFERSPEVLMFQIIDGKLVILGESRTVLYFNGSVTYKDTDLFHVYSTSKVQELVELGGIDITTVEKRNTVLSITNGNVTLEFSTNCPPWCF